MSSLFTKIRKFCFDSEARYEYLKEKNYYDKFDDETFVRKTYKSIVGHKPNLENPTLLTEKLNWLKLYYHDPKFTQMVDKYEAKKLIGDLIGEEYIIPCYGVWENFDDIDFDALPEQFVLKCTHDSGTFVICKDKKTFDKKAAKAKIEARIHYNYYLNCREWPYKHVKPRIIAEMFVDGLGRPDSLEYKVTCFNGKTNFVTICRGIAHDTLEARTNNHFKPDFTEEKWYTYYKNSDFKFEKPAQWEELIALSDKISTGIPYLRVDWYIANGHLYFGETTFYTWGGFMKFEPADTDARLGAMLTLPSEKLLND